MFEALDGWLHCARDPGAVLPAGVPRVRISHSDFVDTDTIKPVGLYAPPKMFDFVYVDNVGIYAPPTLSPLCVPALLCIA